MCSTLISGLKAEGIGEFSLVSCSRTLVHHTVQSIMRVIYINIPCLAQLDVI